LLPCWLKKSSDDNKKCATVYLNLAKAFDTIDHNILITKLNQIGICGDNLKLFSSYLTNRKQCIKINNTSSPFKQIKCEGPQGTVISPIFFNVQINGIHELPHKSQIICYADDIVMLCEADSWDEIFELIS
jgi:sarcosine oxidase/L-pipecolate oxidase